MPPTLLSEILGCAGETRPSLRGLEQRKGCECMKMLGVKEVQEILGIKQTKAYAMIKLLNDELQAKGYLIVRGKVPEEYLRDRFYKK